MDDLREALLLAIARDIGRGASDAELLQWRRLVLTSIVDIRLSKSHSDRWWLSVLHAETDALFVDASRMSCVATTVVVHQFIAGAVSSCIDPSTFVSRTSGQKNWFVRELSGTYYEKLVDGICQYPHGSC